MAIFRKHDGDTPAKGEADGAPPGDEAASNGAPAPDGAPPGDEAASNGAPAPDGAEWIAKSGIPRGGFLYIARGYGPVPDED